jgi:hypothetical protein
MMALGRRIVYRLRDLDPVRRCTCNPTSRETQRPALVEPPIVLEEFPSRAESYKYFETSMALPRTYIFNILHSGVS